MRRAATPGTRRFPRFLLAVMTAAFLAPVLADEAAPPADPNDEKARPSPGGPTSVVVEGTLPYVPTSNTILTRLTLPLRLTPANIGSVSELLLRDQHALVLGDALVNVSGANVHSVSNVADHVSIRGFDSLSNVFVLTDGAPEPEVSYFHMYNVERVEVLKGPGGFLYGRNPLSGALAGVVNIVRRQPVPGTFGTAGVSAGSFGTYDATADVNIGTRNDQLLFRVNSVWRQSDFYRDEKDNRILGVNPAVTWRPGPNSSLNVNLEYVENDFQPDSGLPFFNGEIADVPRERSYQSPFDRSEQELGRVQIDFETRLSDRWSLRNKTYGRDLDWATNGTLINGVFPSQTTGRPEVSRSLLLLDDRQRFVGNQLEAVLSGSTGSVKHRLLLGLETARFGDTSDLDVAFLPNIDLRDPDETATMPLAPIPGQSFVSDQRSVVVAPYAIDQIAFGEKLHALAGARFDRLDFEDDATGDGLEDSQLSPTAGIVYAPTQVLSLYASAGESFGPPPSRAPGADPEEGRQVEIGAKMQLPGGRLQATLAAYHLRRENIGIPDDNGFTQQEGDQRSQGIELEVAFEPRRGLRTFLAYAFNDAELTRFSERVVVGVDPNTFMPIFDTVDRSGNVPAFAPEHILNLWVSQSFDNGLGIGGGGRYVSDQFVAEDNVAEIDGYVTLDAAIRFTHDVWDLSLNFRNLTSREYETRAIGANSVIPAPPLAVYGGVQYRF